MASMKKYLFLVFTCLSIHVNAQFFLYNNSETHNIEMKFTRHEIEASAGQTVFNVIKVVNRSNAYQSYTLNITTPEGWTIIGSSKQDIGIGPMDSLFIPVRVAISGIVRGDIGYSIIAAISDARGVTIKNEYSFIKIKRLTDIKVRLLTRRSYIDQKTRKSELSIQIENKGNREEPISVKVEGSQSLEIADIRQNIFLSDYVVQPYSDTIVNIALYFKDERYSFSTIHFVDVICSTIDTTHSYKTIYYSISDTYNNIIPSNQKAFIAEYNARGLFSNFTNTKHGLTLSGNVLLKNNKDFFYYYNSNDIESPDKLYLDNRMWVGYRQKDFSIRLGQIYPSIEGRFQRTGAQIDFSKGNFSVMGVTATHLREGGLSYGGRVNYKFNNNFTLFSSYASINNSRGVNSSHLAALGGSAVLFKKHRISLIGVYNELSFVPSDDNTYSKTAYGGELRYSFNSRKLRTTLKSKFGTPYLNSSYNGRASLLFNTQYRIDPKSSIVVNITGNKNNPENYFSIPGTPVPSRAFVKIQPYFGYNISPKFYIFGGPGYEISSTDAFSALQTGQEFFSNQIGFLTLGLRFRGEKPSDAINFQYSVGALDVIKAPQSIWNIPKPSNQGELGIYNNFSLNIRRANWGVQAMYSDGPRSVQDHFSWHYINSDSRYLKIMPYYRSFVFKESLYLDLSASYSNDLVALSTYTNINTQLEWILSNDMKIRALNVYSVQSRVTSGGDVDRFQNIYFELGFKKEFGLQQPRQKFYDLNIVFFKDFNGNGKRDDNEPGIKNILFEIERIDDGMMQYQGFSSTELLSDQNGSVSLKRIPSGVYETSYYPIGSDAGTFSKSTEDVVINLDKNTTLNIPFVEKNKVFGKIILNRSRLSGLGRIDLSNVKVTATDSHGRSYSTLTDKNGQFVLFAPITDEYILNINNIFYENFDLRQNNFLVQFNGYKQFEVNFVFDEKVRRINFAATDQEVRQGVQQVRRTTVSGSVKDVNTQQPIRAKINLINTRTNSIITSVNSSATSGDYTLNFMAADNYLLEVLADDYWYMSENLVLQQVTTFMNLNRDILLRPISVGSKVELNIRFDVNSAFLNPEAVAELNRLLRQMKNNPTVRLEIQGHCDDLEAIQKPGVGQERAGAVARYLIENGFSNVEVKDMKNSVPTTSNDTEEGRMRNRRIEVVVLRR